jgi:hypothetical protein
MILLPLYMIHYRVMTNYYHDFFVRSVTKVEIKLGAILNILQYRPTTWSSLCSHLISQLVTWHLYT